jgi:hypothetical protein
MSGFFSSATVKGALVTGVAALLATAPPAVVAIVNDHPTNISCAKVDDAALRFVAAHPRLRAIYAKSGDATEGKWHLGSLASDDEVEACGNPERLIEADTPPVPTPVPKKP